MRNRIGPSVRQLARLRSHGPALPSRCPSWRSACSVVPAQGLGQGGANAESIDALRGEIRSANRRTVFAAGGGATRLAAAVLYGLTARAMFAADRVVLVCAGTALAGARCWRKVAP